MLLVLFPILVIHIVLFLAIVVPVVAKKVVVGVKNQALVLMHQVQPVLWHTLAHQTQIQLVDSMVDPLLVECF